MAYRRFGLNLSTEDLIEPEVRQREALRAIRRTVVRADEALISPQEALSKVISLTIWGLGEGRGG